jgi:type II secretory pathway component PulC
LRTGDVVKALNDEKITGPGEAEVLFRALARRGDFDILVERRGRLQHLSVEKAQHPGFF